MKQFVPSIAPVTSQDDSLWFIQAVDINHSPLYKIHVFLPPSFPTSPPELFTVPVVEHPLVNKSKNGMISDHPLLCQWSSHCNLGMLLADIVTEFVRSRALPIKEDKELFFFLEQLGTRQVEACKGDPIFLRECLKDFPTVCEKQAIFNSLRDISRQAAVDSLRSRSELEELKTRISEKFSFYNSLPVSKKQARSPSLVKTQLSRKISDIEIHLKELNKRFRDGEMELEDFRDDFIQRKKQIHRNKAIIDWIHVNYSSLGI